MTGANASVKASWDEQAADKIRLQEANMYKILMHNGENGEGDPMVLAMFTKEDAEFKSREITFENGLNDVPMVNGKMYAFRIQARNEQGDGPLSEPVYAVPRPDALSSIGGFSSSVAGGGVTGRQVTLTWNEIDLANKYLIYRDEGEDPDSESDPHTSVLPDSCLDGVCTHIETELTNDTTYHYIVRGVFEITHPELLEDQRGNVFTDPSDVQTATPRAISDLQPRLSHSNGDLTGFIGKVNLIIRKPVNSTGIQFTKYTIMGTPKPEGWATDSQEHNYTAGSNTPLPLQVTQKYGVKYTYRVTPNYTAPTGDVATTAIYSDVNVSPDPPGTPANVAAALDNPLVGEETTGNVTVSWNVDPRVTHYEIVRKSGSGAAAPLGEKKISELDSTTSIGKYLYQDNDVEVGKYTYTVTPWIRDTDSRFPGGTDFSAKSGIPSSTMAVELVLPEPEIEPVEFVDPFIGTEWRHAHGYQPTRVYPLAAVPFGMVVFTVANGFHSGSWWGAPNDSGSSGTSGRQKPTYVGTNRNKIKGFSAYSFQGPGCDLGHDFLMMPSTTDAAGAGEWLSNRAAEDPPNDFQIKSPRRIRRTESNREAERGDDDREWAEAGYYRVKTKRNTLIEITATKRTGIMKITYPTNASKGYFHLASYTRTEGFDDTNSFVRVESSGGNKELEGKVRAGKFCGEGGNFRYEMFLSGEFDKTFTSPALRASDNNEIRVEFDLVGGRVVIFKFGLSFVSFQNARNNMIGTADNTGENTGFDFDGIKRQAQADWNTQLRHVEVRDSHDGTGDTYTSDKRRLYTFLFRSALHPSTFSDINGEYVGFDGVAETGSPKKIKELPARQSAQYQYFSNWDVYRSQIPLVGLLWKDVGTDIIRSLVNNANQAGSTSTSNVGGFTRWGVANHDSGVMGGDPAAIMVSDLFAFGAQINKDEAVSVMDVMQRAGKLNDLDLTGCAWSGSGGTCYLTNSSASVPEVSTGVVTANVSTGDSGITSTLIRNNPFSKILELANADYAKYTFYRRSIDREHSYSNPGSRNTAAEGFRVSSATWNQLFRSGSEDSFKARTGRGRKIHQNNQCFWHGSHKCYHEGTASQYRFSMPYDIAGVFEEMNQANTVAADGVVSNAHIKGILDNHFNATDLISGEGGDGYNAGNQAGYGTPYVYHYIGLPNETLNVVRNKLNAYWADNFRTYPGNEDGGSMSAQFVTQFIGLYPHAHGSDRLLLLYPAFDYIKIDFDDGGKTLTLKRDPASTAASSVRNACVEKVTVSGFNINPDPNTAAVVKNNYEYTKSYIHYTQVMSNTQISFKIVPRSGGTCNATSWGKKESDIPLSNTSY